LASLSKSSTYASRWGSVKAGASLNEVVACTKELKCGVDI